MVKNSHHSVELPAQLMMSETMFVELIELHRWGLHRQVGAEDQFWSKDRGVDEV